MIEQTVRVFLYDNFFIDSIGSDESLTQGGTLDSMGVLELILFLEKRFDTSIPDKDTTPENLDSINKIVRYIDNKRK